jgi:hypothetical protein
MRRTLITTVAGAAIAAGMLLGPAGAFASSSAGGTTMHLTAHFTSAVIVDAGDPGPSAGDQQVVAGTLTNGDQQAGRFGFVCELLTVGAQVNEQCDGTGRLGGGQIVVEGYSRQSAQDHTWAIVGGTGTYRDATGQLLIHDVNDTTSTVTVELG